MPDKPSALDVRCDALIDLSAAIASRNRDHLDRALRFAATLNDVDAVDEVILQAHLFVGYPVALEAMVAWRAARHVQPEAQEPREGCAEQGANTCRTIYGANYEKLRQNVAALHPDFDRWMVETGYGRVLSRTGLTLAERELCIVALLAVWDSPRQLHSHLRGAIHAGAGARQVEATLDVAGRYLAPTDVGRLKLLWAQVRPTEADGDRNA